MALGRIQRQMAACNHAHARVSLSAIRTNTWVITGKARDRWVHVWVLCKDVIYPSESYYA